MGLMNLLSTILGGHRQQPQAPQPMASDPTMMPSGAPAMTAQPLSPQQVDEMPPVEVMGDRFKPHRGTILGAIADGYLMAHGGKPMFTVMRQQENMDNAMKGFTENPMQAIRRVGTFDPDTAWKMLNQQTDNDNQKNQLARQNQVLDNANESYTYNRVAGMMGAANEGNWSQMRDQAIAYGKSRNKDVSALIPPEYSPDAIQGLQYGAVPVAKQMQIGEQTRNHDLQHSDRAASLGERSEFHKGLLNQGGARIGISQQNADTSVDNAATAAKRANIYANANQGRAVNSPAGPGVVDRTGNQLTVFTHDGRKLLYIRGNSKDHWRFAHQIIGQDEKAAGTTEPENPDGN